MSKDVHRNQVFQTTRVRTSLKKDVSWIQQSKQESEDKDNARTDHAAETRPVLVRQKSYVLSTIKKFESVDSPQSPPLQTPQFIPSKGDKANSEVIPPPKDAQPEGSTVETTDDAKPQAPTDEVIQNSEAQPEESVAKTTAENADTAIYQSNVEHNKGAAEISVDVHAEEPTLNGEAQPFLSTMENPEATSHVELAEQQVANITAENKGEYADTAVEQSNVEHNEAKVSADAHVEDPVAETSAAAGTKESQHTAEVLVALSVELKPQEEPSTGTQPAAETTVKSVECKVESAASTEPVLKTRAEEIVECEVQPVDNTVVKQSVELKPESATNHLVELNIEKAVEPVAVKVPAVLAVQLKPKEEPSTKTEPANTANVENAGIEPTKQRSEGSSVEQAAEETVAAEAEVAVKSSPVKSNVINATPGEKTAFQGSLEPIPGLLKSISKSPPQPAAKTATEGSCNKGPAEQAAEAVSAVAKVAVKSSPETPAVTNVAEEEAAPQDSVKPVPGLVAETVTKSPTQPAAETTVKSVECKVESAASTEPVLKTRAEEIVECEVQPVDNTVVKQSVELKPESATNHLVELNIEKAVEPVAVKVPAVLAVQLKPKEEPSTKTEPANTANVENAGTEPTKQRSEGSSVEQAAVETVAAEAEVAVKSSPVKSNVINATPGEKTAFQGSLEPIPGLLKSISKSPPEPAAKTATEGSCNKGTAEQAAEAVSAVAKVAVKSSPETPAVTNVAEEEAAPQDSVKPVPGLVAETVTKSPTQPAAETTVKSVECKVESAASTEPVLKARAEEIVECEVQPVDNTVVKQSVELKPESAADRVVELNIEDAVEPVAVQDNVAYRAIELTDAVDVEPPTAVAAPEPLKDPKQPHTEETKLNQQSYDTNTYNKGVCSFCDKIIDGNTKITLNEPPMDCHPHCLKCLVCAKALGDMLTPIFWHNGVIQCDVCFKKALNT